MRRLKGFLAVAATTALLLAGASADATTLMPGGSFGLNFDFTGVSPPPPYLTGTVIVDFAGFDSTDTLTEEIFGGLNGTGSLLDNFTLSGALSSSNRTLSGPSHADFLDGVFSVVFIAGGTGPFDVNVVGVSESNQDGRATPFLTGTAFAQVPEPATLALLGIALAGVSFSRRKSTARSAH